MSVQRIYSPASNSGFSLVETMMTLVISGLVLMMACLVVIMAMRIDQKAMAQALAERDAWTLDTALARDIHAARAISCVDGRMQIVEDTGIINTYRLHRDSRLLLRSVNGRGGAIVAAGVSSLRFTITAHVGVSIAITFDMGGSSFAYHLSAAFREGKPSL